MCSLKTFFAALPVQKPGEECSAHAEPLRPGPQPYDPVCRRSRQVSLALGEPGQCPSSIQHVGQRQHQPDHPAPYDSSGQVWQHQNHAGTYQTR